MTQGHGSSRYISLADIASRPRGLFRPSFASSLHPLIQEGAGKAGCRQRTRGPLREMHTQEEPHSSIQVVPITRPSLRGGRTAYAVLSREPNFPSGLPRPRGIHRYPRRLTQMPPPQELDRSNDGQDHTVLPYARPAISPAVFPALSTKPKTCRRDEPSSAVRPRAATGSPGTTLPARTSRARRCRVHRRPGSRK
jgi:hypothetical protein